MRTLLFSLGLCMCVGVALNAQELEYRELPLLTTTPDTVQPLPLGFTTRSVLPWFGDDEPPALLIGPHGPYYPDRTFLYRAQGKDGRGGFFSLPADFPVYDAGTPFSQMKPGRMIAMKRDDGLFDMVNVSNWTYLKNTGTKGAPAFAESYAIGFDEKPHEGSAWVADVDGDGIPDLLVGGIENRGDQFDMYPGSPWAGTPQANIGMLPDSDIQNFRGYDIAGNWMGNPIMHYLWWSKGRMEDGKLVFGKPTKVRYGQTDYELQWRCYGTNLSPVVMDLENGKHIVMFSDNDKAMAVPVRQTKGEYLHVGKAVPFLKDGATLTSTIHADVIGVADLNGDGKDELLIGSGGNGRITVLQGTRAGEFEELGNVFHRGGAITADTLAIPFRADWDGDGKPDIIIGDAAGILSLRRGTDDPLVYEGYENFRTPSGFIRHRPTKGNLQGDNETAWSYIQPTVFDWDGDGKPDLITNDNAAELYFYKGTGQGALVEEPVRLTYEGKPLPTAWRSRPAVVDGRYEVAGDDRHGLLFLKWDSVMAIAIPDKPGSTNFERIIDLQFEDGTPLKLSGEAGHSGRIKMTVADWDGDGVWDIVFASSKSLPRFFRLDGQEFPVAAPYWMRNIGTNDKPVFALPQMITFADGKPIVTNRHNFNVFPTDLTGDGKLDIIFGDDESFFFYLTRDKLAWDESRDDERAIRMERKKAWEKVGDYGSGATIFAESWDGSTPEGMWASAWMPSKEGIFSPKKGVAVLKMSPPQLSAIRRYLMRPIDLSPKAKTTLEYQVVFTRNDSRNGGSQEHCVLLGLGNSRTRAQLLSVGFDSNEYLEVQLGEQKQSIKSVRMRLGTAYLLTVRMVLDPAQKTDAVDIKLAPVKDPEKATSVQLQAKLSGVADILHLSLAREGGELRIEGLSMQCVDSGQ